MKVLRAAARDGTEEEQEDPDREYKEGLEEETGKRKGKGGKGGKAKGKGKAGKGKAGKGKAGKGKASKVKGPEERDAKKTKKTEEDTEQGKKPGVVRELFPDETAEEVDGKDAPVETPKKGQVPPRKRRGRMTPKKKETPKKKSATPKKRARMDNEVRQFFKMSA